MDLYLSILGKRQADLFKKLKFLGKRGFYLAGGTALALRIGHRTSLDFDFYTKKKFDSLKLQRLLEKKFKEVILLAKAADTLIVRIDNVAVSFFQYPYSLLFPPTKYGQMPPLASKEDIAAMKVIAVSDRGTKRDFIDIYFLLQENSLQQLFGFVKKKYPNFNIYVGLRGLTYFVDAEEKQHRKLYLFRFVSWPEIKKFLIGEVKKYRKECLK